MTEHGRNILSGRVRIRRILKAADKYGSEVIDRVRDVIYEQMRRYLYLF